MWVHHLSFSLGYLWPTGFISVLCPITFSIPLLLPPRDLTTFKSLASKAIYLADTACKSEQDIPARSPALQFHQAASSRGRCTSVLRQRGHTPVPLSPFPTGFFPCGIQRGLCPLGDCKDRRGGGSFPGPCPSQSGSVWTSLGRGEKTPPGREEGFVCSSP